MKFALVVLAWSGMAFLNLPEAQAHEVQIYSIPKAARGAGYFVDGSITCALTDKSLSCAGLINQNYPLHDANILVGGFYGQERRIYAKRRIINGKLCYFFNDMVSCLTIQ